jgi:toxin ParE1/3/4
MTIKTKMVVVVIVPDNKLTPNLRGFVVEDYIVFYYPREDGIDITRVVNGYRDLESLFLDDE